MKSVSRSIDRYDVTFDDPSLVANAGLMLSATLMIRLGFEGLVDDVLRVGFRPGRKVLTLVAALLCGGSHIDHADMLRAGATSVVLPFRIMAPSTLGTFLRRFTHGHVRQLERVGEEMLRRAWALGCGPGQGPLVVDLDSTICEVFGKDKQGAAYGYTKRLGYHPLLATRADTGEVLHARMRKGSSQKGARHFIIELINRLRRCGATGQLTVRADAGFFSHRLIDAMRAKGVHFSVTVSSNTSVRQAIERIDESAWTPIDYTDFGIAQVAETTYVTGGQDKVKRTYRLIVRRTKLNDPHALALFADWRYHAFITDLKGSPVDLDEFHRKHATVELAIRDLKESSGLEHCPSGRFNANAAWMACAVLAHNLLRWSARLGDVHPPNQLTVAKTWRKRLLGVPGRIVNRSGRLTLRMPAGWPWTTEFVRCLDTLRALPATSSG